MEVKTIHLGVFNKEGFVAHGHVNMKKKSDLIIWCSVYSVNSRDEFDDDNGYTMRVTHVDGKPMSNAPTSAEQRRRSTPAGAVFVKGKSVSFELVVENSEDLNCVGVGIVIAK